LPAAACFCLNSAGKRIALPYKSSGSLLEQMSSAFDDTWLQSNAVVEPPTAPEEFDGDLDDIQRFIAYTKSNQPGPRLVAVQNFLWLCERSSLADVQNKVFPATTKFAIDDDNSVREAVASQVAAVISYLRGNNLWGGSCFTTVWQTCVTLLTEKDAQIRVLCEDNVASVAECLSDPLVLQPIVLPSFIGMLQEDEDAVCTALRLMAEIATHSPCEWVRDSVWPVFAEQVSLILCFQSFYHFQQHREYFFGFLTPFQSKSDSFKVRRAVAIHIGKVSVGCASAFTAEHILPCFDVLSKVICRSRKVASGVYFVIRCRMVFGVSDATAL
jgi:hypothetical protein